MRVASRWVVLVAGVNAVGCSGPTDSHSSSGGSSGSVGAAGSTAGVTSGGGGAAGNAGSSSGGGDGGGTQTAGGDASTPVRWGVVQLLGLLGSSTSSTTQVGARFGDPEHPQPEGTPACDLTTFGACTISTCAADYVAPDTSMVAAPSAGKIAWTDGDKVTGEITPDALGRYTNFARANLDFSGGETLTVSGSGADVPAFSSTVPVPLSLLHVSPPADDTGHLVWPKTQDLVLTFERGMADIDLYVQSMGRDPTNHTYLYCTLPSASGTATIPQAALSKLSSAHKILLTTARKQDIAAGDYSVAIWTILGLLNQAKTYRIQLELQ